jgi:hypothetical protein
MNPPRLTISDLRRIGLLGEVSAGVQVVAEGVTFGIDWFPEHNSLKTVCVVGPVMCKSFIEIVWQEVGEGKAPFFYCANTDTAVTSIYFDDRQWACRTWFTVSRMFVPTPERLKLGTALDKKRRRLLGQDGRAPPRGKRRQSLVKYFRHYQTYVKQFPELASALRYEASRVAREPVARARAASQRALGPSFVELPTESSPAVQLFTKETIYKKAAMANYPWAKLTGMNPAAIFPNASLPLPSKFEIWLQSVPPLKPRSGARKLEFVEDTPVLDIQQINFDGLSAAELTAYTLEWTRKSSPLRVSALMMRAKPDGYWLYLQHDVLVGAIFQQAVRVELNSTGKQRFVCPFTRNRCSKLYYRDMSFASLVPQRLTYRSQRKA